MTFLLNQVDALPIAGWRPGHPKTSVEKSQETSWDYVIFQFPTSDAPKWTLVIQS